MKISTKGRYALRMMLDLARHRGGGFIALKDIAQRQNISKKYLEQIVPLMNKADILKTNRGYQGGYKLAREPHEYTVGEILRVTEGSLAPVACLATDENTCENCMDCVTLEIWQCVLDAVNKVVDSITLQYLVDKQKEKGNCGCC